jgi:hypothetical protein
LRVILRMPSAADLGQVFLGSGAGSSRRHLASIANRNPNG